MGRTKGNIEFFMNMDEPRIDADIEEDHKRERENLRKQIDQKK